jgi:hypothetical protein
MRGVQRPVLLRGGDVECGAPQVGLTEFGHGFDSLEEALGIRRRVFAAKGLLVLHSGLVVNGLALARDTLDLGDGGPLPALQAVLAGAGWAVTVCGGCYLLLWALRCGPRFSAARQAILASELEAGRGGGLSRAAETELIGSLKSEVHVLKVSTSLS